MTGFWGFGVHQNGFIGATTAKCWKNVQSFRFERTEAGSAPIADKLATSRGDGSPASEDHREVGGVDDPVAGMGVRDDGKL